MFYNFMELPDKTIISHSELIKKDGKEQVKVYIEKPIYGGFATATCYLPEYKWTEVSGFTEKEMEVCRQLGIKDTNEIDCKDRALIRALSHVDIAAEKGV